MITPVEISNVEFKKSFRGYNEEEVDNFLLEVGQDYEALYKENMELKERLKLYQEQISRYKSIEETLNATLITAQSAAEDTCVAANKKAKIIVEEAQLQSKYIVDETNNRLLDLRRQYENLTNEFKSFRNNFKSILQREMDTLDELFADASESYNVPFREFNYIKDDIEDTQSLFTGEDSKEEVVEPVKEEVAVDIEKEEAPEQVAVENTQEEAPEEEKETAPEEESAN